MTLEEFPGDSFRKKGFSKYTVSNPLAQSYFCSTKPRDVFKINLNSIKFQRLRTELVVNEFTLPIPKDTKNYGRYHICAIKLTEKDLPKTYPPPNPCFKNSICKSPSGQDCARPYQKNNCLYITLTLMTTHVFKITGPEHITPDSPMPLPHNESK